MRRWLAELFIAKDSGLTDVERQHIARILAGLIFPVVLAIGLFVIVVGLLFWNEGRKRIDAVNESRARVTFEACQDQNKRHDQTIKTLDRLLAQRVSEVKDPQQRAQVEVQSRATREYTVVIIDSLLPAQDCEKLVADRFGG